MGTAVMVSVLNTLKDVRQHTAGNTTGDGNGDAKSGNPS
jgi:hypothetical protein